jgi:hypothetical protein
MFRNERFEQGVVQGESTDLLRWDDVIVLISHRAVPCITVYMPTHRSGIETLQGSIRLKNHLREIDRRLSEFRLPDEDVQELLYPLQNLIQDYDFWQRQSDGLAIFRSKEILRLNRLPVPLQDFVVVGGRFHINSVLRFALQENRFLVLALSQNQIRLIECTRSRQELRELPADMPQRIRDSRSPDAPQAQLQSHSAGRARGTAIFHGNPSVADLTKEELLHHFQRVDRSLQPILRTQSAPLVLAAVDYLMPIYRTANTYAHLVSEGVPGNPDDLTPAELRERAWRVVEPVFGMAVEKALDRYARTVGEGKASNDLATVIRAAAQGRTELLILAEGAQRWGSSDFDTFEVRVHDAPQPGDEDLIDLAAALTLEKGGAVHVLSRERIPGRSDLAAVFRY